MGCIVCATRGGEGSRAVQLQAIQRSLDREKRLIFLYVTDTHTAGDVDQDLLTAVHAELDWMGNTLLRVAQQRAQLAGLDSDIAILHGDVREEIGRFLSESQAELLLLGAPRGTSANVFGDDAVEQFAATIQEKTLVPVEVVRPDVVVKE
ncbi:MAG: universal stress protein [Anaerolineales bacterium]|nr:universal stress protein [Anaerolineales bacterium]MCB8989997.1 universal stress protein [Ardenticatenaceae bacterium]